MSTPTFPILPRQVSIVVPTYKEVLNIPVLARRVDEVMKQSNLTYEIIFVDDNSNDGSIQAVELLRGDNLPVKIIVRTTARGLSSAVLRGFDEAQYPTLLVMDADLQHDPIYIPDLVTPIINGYNDFSIGSRHVNGGEITDWALHRRIISWGATLIAKPLISCSDPMSGYFALPKTTLQRAQMLNPLGYKIALELMVRCNTQYIQEVPIIFRDRTLGESKLTLKTNILYLMHISQLYLDCKPEYVILFTLSMLIILVYIAKRFILSSGNTNTSFDHDNHSISNDIDDVTRTINNITSGSSHKIKHD